jgi:hypothetical protein
LKSILIYDDGRVAERGFAIRHICGGFYVGQEECDGFYVGQKECGGF